MASFHVDFWGPKVALTTSEVNAIANAVDKATAFMNMLLPIVPSQYHLAIKVISLFIKYYFELVKRVDRGNGVWLTLPWAAVWWQQWWLVVPTPR